MPITREEKLLNTLATGVASGVEPITREEQYLAYIAGETATKPDAPITRKEAFLDRVPQGGGGGGETSMEDALVERTITEYSNDRVKSVGEYSFYGYEALTSIDFPKVTSIGVYAFDGCESLTNVNLPAVTSIGIKAFKNCYSLTSVNLPAVTRIGMNAFDNCESLTNVNLPAVTSIDDEAFYRCTSLTNVNLPAVTSIGSYAFYYCTALKALIVRNTETVCVCKLTALNDSGIDGVDGFIYIPTSMYDAYAAAYGDYIALFRKIEDYPEICDK